MLDKFSLKIIICICVFVAISFSQPPVVTIQNEDLIVNVNTNLDEIPTHLGTTSSYWGQFSIAKKNKDGTVSPLLYNPIWPATSRFELKIDDRLYYNAKSSPGIYITPRQGSTPDYLNDSTITCTWQNEGVMCTQELTLVELNEQPTVMIKYVLKNVSSRTHDVGLSLLLDIDITGKEPDSIAVVSSKGYSLKDQKFVGKSNVPQFYQIYNTRLQDWAAQGTLKGGLEGSLATPPDIYLSGERSNLENTNSSWTFAQKNEDYNDNAVRLVWGEQQLDENESREIITYYGLGNINTNPGALTVTATAPTQLVYDENQQLYPNPFEALLIISNEGMVKSTNIRGELYLPEGLYLENESIIKTMNDNGGVLNPGESGIVFWKVFAASSAIDQTFEMDFTVTSDNDQVDISRSVFVPKILEFNDDFAVPNPITPNGDGYNDETVFLPFGEHETGAIKLFNINGDLVNSIAVHNSNEWKWDGTDQNGQIVPMGVYLYVAEVDNHNLKQGTITVIK